MICPQNKKINKINKNLFPEGHENMFTNVKYNQLT